MSKVILVTGTSSGFGNDMARTLAAAGHRVFAAMRDVQGRNRSVAEELRAADIETIELDVTDNASVQTALAALGEKTAGRLDVLVNNAGIASGGLAETFTPEQVRDLFEVNVFGVQRVIGASKHAVEALTDGYRYELSQQGIDVVLVQPGPYPTGLWSSIQKPADPGRAESYGDVAALPGQFVEFLQGVFASAQAPDPHEIAKVIADLVAMPDGTRPDRIVVGLAFGADAANEALRPLQRQVIDGIGMAHLTTARVA